MRKCKYNLVTGLLILSFTVSGQRDSVINKIINLGIAENKVMEHMDILTNRLGDRLTGL